MMYKTPTFAEPQQYNRPFSTGQLSAFIIQTDKKKSCNKNSMKNTEMLEKYIINIHAHVYILTSFLLQLFFFFLSLRGSNIPVSCLNDEPVEKILLYC